MRRIGWEMGIDDFYRDLFVADHLEADITSVNTKFDVTGVIRRCNSKIVTSPYFLTQIGHQVELRNGILIARIEQKYSFFSPAFFRKQ